MSFASMRKKAKLTMAEVADKLEVTPAAVCQWERGQTKPRAEKLIEIAELYGCTVDELLKEDE